MNTDKPQNSSASVASNRPNTRNEQARLPKGFKLVRYIHTIRPAVPAITETLYAVENLTTKSFLVDCCDTPKKAIEAALKRIKPYYAPIVPRIAVSENQASTLTPEQEKIE